MRKIPLAAALAMVTFSAVAGPAAEVNPLIGTANGGNVFPGAVMPFGMVQFSPEATPLPGSRHLIAAKTKPRGRFGPPRGRLKADSSAPCSLLLAPYVIPKVASVCSSIVAVTASP